MNTDVREKTEKLTIGILGGMGPAAAAYMHGRVIALAQEKYAVAQDSDYPPLLVYSPVITGLDENGLQHSEDTRTQVVRGVQHLEKAGSHIVAVACNTVHCFYDDMQRSVSVPVLNMVDATSAKVAAAGIRTVGIMASSTSIQSGLYQQYLEQRGITAIAPNSEQQKVINEVIFAVMSGRSGSREARQLSAIVGQMAAVGAEGVILGCTELPVAFTDNATVPIFDCIDIAAESLLEFSFAV